MNTLDNRDQILADIRRMHVALEHVLQALNVGIGQKYCASCTDICCREEICRDSLESAFLQSILSENPVDYDGQKGWLSPFGCRLTAGRPMLCYRFYCSAIGEADARPPEALANRLHAVYKNAYGTRHFFELENLDVVKTEKLRKIRDLLAALYADCSTVTVPAGQQSVPPIAHPAPPT